MLQNKEEEFIKENMGLVHSCCKRFLGRGIEYDDLFQAGCMGLLKASRDFDATRGFMFSTYAVPVILGEIKRIFRDTGAVKVSRSLKELSLKINHLTEKIEKTTGIQPTVNELAERLSATAEEINEALLVSKPVFSLTVENDDGVQQLDLPVVSDEETVTNRLLINQAICNLEGNDRKIIFYRYFCGMTQSEVAQKLNMTQVQVSRREKKLLLIMKSNIS